MRSVDQNQIADRLRGAGCVFADDEAELLIRTADGPAQLEAMVTQRTAGRPLEHVVGQAEFCGLSVGVTSGVFVPRQRSRFLVEQALAVAEASLGDPRADDDPPLVVVDLCCGSGAIGLAVTTALLAAPARRREVELHAADLDPAAVDCARRNLAGVGGQVHLGDLYHALPAELSGRVDLVLANTPYVPTAELAMLPAEARLHEPRLALDGGVDGLDVLRRVATGSTGWLAPGGHLLIEIHQDQGSAAAQAFRAAGLVTVIGHDAERGAAVITGRRPRRCP